MIYRLSRTAESDIEEIYRYTVETFGHVQAALYLGGLESVFELLCEHPDIGTKFDDTRRRYVFKSHVVYYRQTEDHIVIVTIRHSSRRAPGIDE